MLTPHTLLGHRKYSLLLVSCLLIIVALPVEYNLWFRTFIFSFNVAAGLIVVGARKDRQAVIIKIAGYSTIALQLMGLLFSSKLFQSALLGFYITYFISISFTVYHDIYRAKEIDVEMISAVFCGFIMLGLLTAFSFELLESIHPNSFSGYSGNSRLIDDLVYFSFISLLTIGYGDMAPITDVAKTACILAGLTGQFYTVFVTGIVIGKFISGRSQS